MRYYLVIFFLLLKLIYAEDEAGLAQLKLIDGIVMTGEVIKASEGEALSLKSAGIISSPVSIDAENIIYLEYKDMSVPADSPLSASLTCQSRIDGQVDYLIGVFESLEEDKVIVTTPYAGVLNLRRSMLKNLEVKENSVLIFQDFGKSKDWISEDDKMWNFGDDGNISPDVKSESLARELPKLPEKFVINFFLEWTNSPNFICSFLNKDNDTPIRSGYRLIVNTKRCRLEKFSLRGRGKQLSPISVGSEVHLGEIENGKFSLYINQEIGQIVLFCNGYLLREWRDVEPELLTQESSWFQLMSQYSPSYSFANLMIEEWDGELPLDQAPSDLPEVKEAPPEYYEIALQNNDIVFGKILGIKKQIVSIETQHGEISIPIIGLKNLDVSIKKYEKPRLQKGDVRVTLKNKYGDITVQLEELTSSYLEGYSEVFGNIKIDVNYIQRIDFNIYRDEFSKLR